MATEVTLPRQGWSMEEAAFVEWLKHDGDAVRAGEPLFSVETDKAVQEIESLDAGILRLTATSPKAGDQVRVGSVLGYLVAAGETPPAGAAAPTAEREAAAPVTETAPPKAAAGAPAMPAKAAAAAAAPAGRPVSPRAARRAVQEGVDLRTVAGSGRGGRVRESDVVAARQGKAVPAPAASAPVAPAMPPIPGRDVPVTTLRRTIADRMHRSKTLTAPVTLTTRADAGTLVRLRERFKATAGDRPVPAYGDLIMRQVALALQEHPALNARWEEDRIRFPAAVNIGFAVDTDAGLMVPVVPDAPRRSLLELAALTRDLAERAKARRLALEELSGGTFTITNLGSSGIEVFTPIVNWPECAVLGVGRIAREPVVEGETVVVGHRLWLSLTFDHRIVDGAPAARFLDAVRRGIENPL